MKIVNNRITKYDKTDWVYIDNNTQAVHVIDKLQSTFNLIPEINKESATISFLISGYDDEINLWINYKRLETDDEYNIRLKQLEKIKEVKKYSKKTRVEKERKEYKRLKKKFEGISS